ncbi:hypothetical protein ARSEF4850_002352 [Beauveria asiatica]
MDTQLASSSIHANQRRTVTPIGSLDRSMLLEAEMRRRQATDQITTGVNGLTLGPHDGEESQEPNNRAGLVTNFQTPAGTKFCDDCIHARNEPEYAIRIENILAKRRCSACDRRHGGFLFSKYQRHRTDEVRVCIGAEGFVTVCPHTTLSLKDMDNFLVMHPEQDYKRRSVPSCPHEPCISLNLQAEYRWNPMSKPGQQSVYIEWSTEITSDNSRDWREQVVEKATELVKNHPKLFCPHIRAVPARFGDISSIVRNQFTCIHDEKFEMSCFSCDQAIYLDEVDSQANGGRIRLRGWRRVRVDTGSKMRGCHWKWLSNIEPDSFGLHQDSEAMNISWCHGGPACATNYGYLHYTELLFNAAQPNCELFAALYKEKHCVPYQPFMDEDGGRGVHGIDIKAAKMQRHN